MRERVLDHIGIAVHSLDQAIPVWEALAGASPSPRDVVDTQGVEVVFLGSGPGRVELLAPTRPDSPIGRFLERGGPGMHHLCYRVQNLETALADFAARGYHLIDTAPRSGAFGHRVAFLHPRTAGGVLVELVEEGG
ncbi:MAG: methylmalonyl-CoA epimerase [Gemmatimonadetes bacterium]|nr:methylmalonyl-CoA epimerase [Gemmatimonadota bacterium]